MLAEILRRLHPVRYLKIQGSPLRMTVDKQMPKLKSTPKPKTVKRSKTDVKQKSPGASISHSHTLAELAEFWDTHDTTEYPVEWVDFEVDIRARRHYVAVDPDILNGLRQVAESRGLSTESLINLWLQERLTATTPRPS